MSDSELPQPFATAAMHSPKLPPWTTAWANSPLCRQKDSSASFTAVFITDSYLFP